MVFICNVVVFFFIYLSFGNANIWKIFDDSKFLANFFQYSNKPFILILRAYFCLTLITIHIEGESVSEWLEMASMAFILISLKQIERVLHT